MEISLENLYVYFKGLRGEMEAVHRLGYKRLIRFLKKSDNFKLFLKTIILMILLYIFHNYIHTTSLKLSILQHKDGNKTGYV